MAILSHFRDQKKYFSQAVRNTLRRSVKIQSALFKKYCRSYLCLWEVPPPHYIDRAIDAVTVSVDSCSAHRVRPNSPVISGTHIRNTFVLSNILQLNGAHFGTSIPISETKENKKKSKKKVSFDLFPEICSFWQVTNNASFYVAQYLANLSQLDNNLVKFAQLTLPGFISAVNYDKSIFVKKSKFHTMKVKVER